MTISSSLLPLARRSLVVALACMALTAITAVGTASAETIELKVSNYMPPTNALNLELKRWADELASKSQGRLKLSIYPSSQMGPITRQFDLARTGVADMSFFLHGALPGRFPMTELAQLPYAFNPESSAGVLPPLSSADASAIVTSLSGQLAKEYEGTRILYLVVEPNIGLFFNKAVVRKPADMKGMRIRHNGPLPAKMIEAWGATPAAIAPVELADSLEKGSVNGMEFNYEATQSYQLGETVKSVTELNAYAITFALVMNSKKYESLPADLRKLIDDSTGVEAARRVGARFDEAEAAGRKYVLEHKAEIVVPTPADTLAFKTPLKPLVDQTIDAAQAKGLAARKFYDEMRAQVNGVKR